MNRVSLAGRLSRAVVVLMTFCIPALALLIAGCNVDLANPPRLATATVRAEASPTATRSPVVLHAPTPTPAPQGVVASEPAPLSGRTLTVWINESSPAHAQALGEMAEAFQAETGVNVALQLVSPSLLPELVNTAAISYTLPDLVLHPVEYTAGWVERGILDAVAADAAIDAIGRETFDPAALALVEIDGRAGALPSDGYHQLFLYRRDWFEEQNLPPPDNYEAMLSAAATLSDTARLISGVIIPTESNLVTTHQAFEHLALANGCRLIDEAGEVRLLDDACREALNHYFSLINRYSPPGVQTDTSAGNAFVNGRTAMIMTSPTVLPRLSGLDPMNPDCEACILPGGADSQASKTGILTELEGSGPDAAPVAFGNVTNLGITTAADVEAAKAFARFWFNEGYEQWLAVEPERKVPMRWGTTDDPRRFIDAWGTQLLSGSTVSLLDLYGADTVAQLRDGVAAAPRWGLREGHGELITRLHEEYVFPIVLQEMLSGYFRPEETINEAVRRVVAQIPNYAFPLDLPETE